MNRAADAATVVLLLVAAGTVADKYWPSEAETDTGRPIANWDTVSSGPVSMGNPDGVRTVVVFSDFQCPACARAAQVLRDVVRHNPDLRIVYRHFPLESIHPQAADAALASECARGQGRFADYHDALFRETGLTTEARWSEIARLVGVLDVPLFEDCIAQRAHDRRILKDTRMGMELGVRATPTIIVEGILYEGVPPISIWDALSANVDRT